MNYLKQEMGNDFVEEMEPLIREYTGKAWKEGSVYAKIKTGVASDKDALNYFAKSGKYDFGKVFSDYSPEMKKAVENALNGKNDVSHEVIADIASRTVGQEMTAPAILDRYRLVVSNAVNKSRNYARTLTYEEIGIQELEIVAMMDDRTSDICNQMNGRRITVRTAATFVRDVMSTDPADVVKKFPWPKSVPAGKTSDIVSALDCKLPPYHARCRTTTVVGLPERIVTKTGRNLSELKSPDENDIRKSVDRLSSRVTAADKIAEIKKSLNTSAERYKDLSSDELASKINALRGSRWGQWTDSKGNINDDLKNHWDNSPDRQKELREKFGDKFSKQDYIKLSEETCRKFTNVYVQFYSGRHRVIFYDDLKKVSVVVDADTSRIVTCYPAVTSAEKDFGGRFHELK